MSFLITVAVPKPDDFYGNVKEMRNAGMRFIPERKCWVGEADDLDCGDAMIIVGEFRTDSLIMNYLHDEIVALIDRCADFKQVGR